MNTDNYYARRNLRNFSIVLGASFGLSMINYGIPTVLIFPILAIAIAAAAAGHRIVFPQRWQQ